MARGMIRFSQFDRYGNQTVDNQTTWMERDYEPAPAVDHDSVTYLNKKLADDVAKGPDKTVSGLLMSLDGRFSAADGMIRNGDIRSAEKVDEAILKDIAPYQDAISSYSNMDDSICPEGSTAYAVRAAARRITSQSDANRSVPLPGGGAFRYGDLRNPEALRQHDASVAGLLNRAEYSVDAQKLAVGDVSRWYQEPSPEAEQSSRRAYRFMDSVTSNDRTAILNGVSLVGDLDSLTAHEVSSAVGRNWKEYDDVFGDYLVDVSSDVRRLFRDGGSGQMMGAALEIGKALSAGTTDKSRIAEDTVRNLRAVVGAAKRSDSAKESGRTDEYGAYAGYSAVANAVKMLAKSGTSIDLSSPESQYAITKVSELSAKMAASRMDLFGSMRDRNLDVAGQLGSSVARAAGWKTPSSMIDVAEDIMSDRTFVGASDFVSRQFSPTTKTSDYTAQRRNGGASSSPLADRLAASLNDVKKRHVWAEAVRTGSNRADSWSSIMSDPAKTAGYVWEISEKLKENLVGSESDRSLGARVLAKLSVEPDVKLVDSARALVQREDFRKSSPGAYRSIKGWLDVVGSSDAELSEFTGLLSAKYAAEGIGESEATGSVVREMDVIRKMKDSKLDYSGAFRELMSRVLLPVESSDGFILRRRSLSRLAGTIQKIGDEYFEIPANPSPQDYIDLTKRINRASTSYVNTERMVRAAKEKKED